MWSWRSGTDAKRNERFGWESRAPGNHVPLQELLKRSEEERKKGMFLQATRTRGIEPQFLNVGSLQENGGQMTTGTKKSQAEVKKNTDLRANRIRGVEPQSASGIEAATIARFLTAREEGGSTCGGFVENIHEDRGRKNLTKRRWRRKKVKGVWDIRTGGIEPLLQGCNLREKPLVMFVWTTSDYIQAVNCCMELMRKQALRREKGLRRVKGRLETSERYY
ncbi:hypothetical protein DFH06DRAFT_1129387 [Mycena polygramma]|nr:hypothetical protein DFH06DRAFT_1129387 [Mycena polygramma]